MRAGLKRKRRVINGSGVIWRQNEAADKNECRALTGGTESRTVHK